jgi:hypothetical protein
VIDNINIILDDLGRGTLTLLMVLLILATIIGIERFIDSIDEDE